MTDTDKYDLLYAVCMGYVNRLNGISYGSTYSFDYECFIITVRYTYQYSGTSNVYTEKIPDYVFNFEPQSAMAKIEVILRNLITRSFRVEVNHMFGKDFNPL